MTKKLSLILVSLFLSINLFAGDHPHVEMTQEEQQQIEMLGDKYDWLYQILMPEDLKSDPGAKKSFSVHLRDSVKFFPKPKELSDLTVQSKAKAFLVGGNMTYVGFFPKPYRYTVTQLEDGTYQFKVLVYLKGATNSDFNYFSDKIRKAQDLWNANRFDFGIPYVFKFGLVTEQKYAHFKPTVKDKTRDPYDTFWSRGWTEKTIAHELGHMLGLGDEYQTLTGNIDCIRESLMCTRLMYLPFHNYHIVRRLFTKAAIKKEF